jgi:hypothetical protein
LRQTAYKPSEEKYKLSYYEIEKSKVSSYSSSNDDDKWRLFTKALTSSPTTRTITSVQRQYFVKIQRGKIDAEKLLFQVFIRVATKTLYVKVIQLKDMRADSLEVIICSVR